MDVKAQEIKTNRTAAEGGPTRAKPAVDMRDVAAGLKRVCRALWRTYALIWWTVESLLWAAGILCFVTVTVLAANYLTGGQIPVLHEAAGYITAGWDYVSRLVAGR
ncbi:hypothetical protein [Desulfofundulus thermocisternus]|uniref:hypothetical protein n=1 Tax=Desulfofundulus thermocisternus TaxID=42471 RepID=UPI000486BB29|nr:hypothetical protein [Desulfofundulus thermocisternus]